MVDEPGQKGHQCVADQLGPGQAVDAEEPVQQEEHGDVDHEPAHNDQEERSAALAERLEKVDVDEAHEHHDRGEHADPEEIRPQGDGRGVPDEDPDEIRGEELVEGDAGDADRDARGACRAQDGLHSRQVSCGIIVGGEGDHAQAEADADVERQPLRLEDDSDRGEGDVAVGGHQPVQHNVVQVKEEGPHGGR